jgi:hypothetical protein
VPLRESFLAPSEAARQVLLGRSGEALKAADLQTILIQVLNDVPHMDMVSITRQA